MHTLDACTAMTFRAALEPTDITCQKIFPAGLSLAAVTGTAESNLRLVQEVAVQDAASWLVRSFEVLS